jgi:glutamine synthetase
MVTSKAKEMLTRLGIFSEAEIVSRYHVQVERYVKVMLIEGDTLRSMVTSQILPVCYAYHGELLNAAAAGKAAGIRGIPQNQAIDDIGEKLEKLQKLTAELGSEVDAISGMENQDEAAKRLASQLSPKMEAVRAVVDDLEMEIPDAQWPLPKYWEMLFLA